MAVPIPLPRTAKVQVPLMIGKDMEAHGRAMHIFLDDGQLGAFHKQSSTMKRTFGTGKRTLAKKCAAKAGLPEYGMVGPNLYWTMRKAGAYDRYADALLVDYMTPKIPSLIYPLDADWTTRNGGYLHETGGIKYNWAYDFMAAPGTPILAMQDGIISRMAGHPPSSGLHGEHRDVFGWSFYLKVSMGFYYGTHMGNKYVGDGERIKVGDMIGRVGDWPYDRGRSHLHLGFTHITHLSYLSKKRINEVANGPRISVNDV